MKPKVHPSCYIAPTARIIGNVVIEKGASVWENAVLRGDINTISVGEGANIQDNVTIHVERTNPTRIGADVSIGHNAMVHGAIIEDRCIIGINSTTLNGAVVGEGSIIGGNALVKEGMVIPKGSLAVGIPARVIKEGDPAIAEMTLKNARSYQALREEYLAGKYQAFVPRTVSPRESIH